MLKVVILAIFAEVNDERSKIFVENQLVFAGGLVGGFVCQFLGSPQVGLSL